MRGTSKKHARALRRDRALPNDACPSCGTMMKEARGRLTLPINGEQMAVPSMSHLKCPKCREIVLRFQEARHLHENAIELS